MHIVVKGVYYKIGQLTFESGFSWNPYLRHTGTTCTIQTTLFSLSSTSAILLFVFEFWMCYCMKHILKMYTIWKVQVLAACCFLFQGIPSFIKRYTCILPIVHLFSLTELLSAGVFWLLVTLALTPNKTAACHLCIKLMTQYCSRRNSLKISFYLKGFRPILRKIHDFNQNEKISTAHGVPKRSPI